MAVDAAGTGVIHQRFRAIETQQARNALVGRIVNDGDRTQRERSQAFLAWAGTANSHALNAFRAFVSGTPVTYGDDHREPSAPETARTYGDDHREARTTEPARTYGDDHREPSAPETARTYGDEHREARTTEPARSYGDEHREPLG